MVDVCVCVCVFVCVCVCGGGGGVSTAEVVWIHDQKMTACNGRGM